VRAVTIARLTQLQSFYFDDRDPLTLPARADGLRQAAARARGTACAGAGM